MKPHKLGIYAAFTLVGHVLCCYDVNAVFNLYSIVYCFLFTYPEVKGSYPSFPY